LDGQLKSLREDFRKVPEDELFRMYLDYMVKYRPEHFKRIVESAMKEEFERTRKFCKE